jgi:membrane protease YdiL (CAAX protease family)
MKNTDKHLVAFFVITFTWSWLINGLRILAGNGLFYIPPFLSMIMGYVALFGPSVAAFYLTARIAGKAGVKQLWQRGWKFNFQKKWLVPAIFLVPVAALITLLIINLTNHTIAWEAALPSVMIVPIGLLIWLLNAYPEEYGWRGFALDRLQSRFNPLMASILLGIIWGVWHLPLHFIEGTTQFYIPVVEFILQTIVLSVLYTWLHNGSGGSIFIAALFHTTGNLAGATIPYWTTGFGRWVSFIILLIPAILIVIFRFARQSRPVIREN